MLIGSRKDDLMVPKLFEGHVWKQLETKKSLVEEPVVLGEWPTSRFLKSDQPEALVEGEHLEQTNWTEGIQQITDASREAGSAVFLHKEMT